MKKIYKITLLSCFCTAFFGLNAGNSFMCHRLFMEQRWVERLETKRRQQQRQNNRNRKDNKSNHQHNNKGRKQD